MTSYALACPIPVGSRYFTAEADRHRGYLGPIVAALADEPYPLSALTTGRSTVRDPVLPTTMSGVQVTRRTSPGTTNSRA